jgi:hypothetical protein
VCSRSHTIRSIIKSRRGHDRASKFLSRSYGTDVNPSGDTTFPACLFDAVPYPSPRCNANKDDPIHQSMHVFVSCSSHVRAPLHRNYFSLSRQRPELNFLHDEWRWHPIALHVIVPFHRTNWHFRYLMCALRPQLQLVSVEFGAIWD